MIDFSGVPDIKDELKDVAKAEVKVLLDEAVGAGLEMVMDEFIAEGFKLEEFQAVLESINEVRADAMIEKSPDLLRILDDYKAVLRQISNIKDHEEASRRAEKVYSILTAVAEAGFRVVLRAAPIILSRI